MRLVLAPLLLAACTGTPEDTGYTEACPVLALDREEVLFANANLNQQTHTSLEVRNDCQGFAYLELTASLSGDRAFTLEDTVLSLPPTGSGSLGFSFFSSDTEPHQAELLLEAEGLDPLHVLVWGMVGADSTPQDRDADGWDNPEHGGDDCDDYDPAVHPGAEEVWYDGTDQDCAGDDDFDQDGDGHRHADHDGDDCDDQQPASCPGLAESADLIDNDCDGLVDEDWVAADDLLITEVMIAPAAVGAEAGQWLELYNTSSHDVDLVGMELVDASGARQTIDGSVVIEAGGYGVLGASDQWTENGGVDVAWAWNPSSFVLTEGPGTWQLVMDPGGGELVVASFSVSSGWCVQAGQATGLSADRHQASTDPDDWCLSTAPLPLGDQGSPGQANEVCPAVDADADSWLHPLHCGADCDDTDPEVHPAATEAWGNGKDDDCDGSGEQALVTDVADGWVQGDGASQRLGYRSNLSAGDVDDDGRTELIVGAIYGDLDGGSSYEGGVWILEAADGLSAAGSVDTVDEALVTGASTYHYLGSVGAWQADNDGDGQVDLFLGGQDALGSEEGNTAATLFLGPLSGGAYDTADADLVLTGSLSSIKARAHGGLDLDDDGAAELVYGESEINYGAGDPDNYKGRVAVLEASGLSGSVDLDDADLLLEGDDRADYLGSVLGGADLDGDGHDDLAMGARGDSDVHTTAGAVYWLMGDTTLPADGSVSTRADLIIQGQGANHELGSGPEPQVGDVDGDGKPDLVLAAYEAHAVYVFLDAAGLSGTVSTSSADLLIQSAPTDTDRDGVRDTPDDFGCGLAVGDLDGDGVDDLAIGAPDDDTDYPPSYSEVEGQVFLFFGGTLAASMSAADAGSTVTGASVGDAFGQSLLSVDLDGSGTEDLVIDAPGASSDYGRVYFVALPREL